MKVHGCWVDLVHLRSESYSEDSRIPTSVEFGTPAEDAVRRDLTVNALFYNLHSRCVEDFTGRGLEDLRQRVARTPLPALQTLLDDPLRALRAVRLAAKLGLSLDSELEDAARHPSVSSALSTKVSRERVGVEVESMLMGPHPVDAATMLARLGLSRPVCSLPPPVIDAAPPSWPWACAASLASGIAAWGGVPGAAPACDDDRRVALLAAWLSPLRSVLAPSSPKPTPLPQHVLREALKLRGKDAEGVARLHASSDAFAPLLAPGAPTPSRARLGRLLRSAKGSWRTAIALAAAFRALPGLRLSSSGAPEEGGAPRFEACACAPPESLCVGLDVAGACSLVARCEALGLDNCWAAKPLLTGGEVQAALGLPRAGPGLGQWVDALIGWELSNPGKDKGHATAWLKAHAGQASPPPGVEDA